MDACEYCGGHEAVSWNFEAGDICKACEAKREEQRLEREARAEEGLI